MATAAKISIAIEAQTATLQKGFDEAKSAIKRLDSGMSGSVAMGMAKFNAGLMAVKAGLGAIQGAVQSVLGAMDEIGGQVDLAQRLGANADQLVALGFAAEQSGSSVDSFNSAVEKLQNNAGEALAGNQAAADSFARIGISVGELKGLQADQVFAKVAEQIQLLGDDTMATKVAIDLFGRAGGELLPLLKGGAEGLNEMGQQAQEMGLLLGDNRDIVEAAGDAISAMKRAWGALVQQVAIAVAPALKAIAEILTSIVAAFNRLLGRATGAQGTFQTFASEGKKAAKSVEDSMAKTEKAAKTAAGHVRESWKDIPKPTDYTTPGAGAVTRGTAAGFSAVQEAERARRDAERRHTDIVAWLAKINRAQRDDRLTLATVDL